MSCTEGKQLDMAKRHILLRGKLMLGRPTWDVRPLLRAKRPLRRSSFGLRER